MHKSTTFTVATAVAAMAALTLSIAPADAQQDWRRGGFEERHGAHNFGEFCVHRVVTTGFAHVNFLGSGRDAVRKAEARAVRSWENQVSAKFGPQFASFARANGKANQCNHRGSEFECTISAHPCRDRGPGHGGPGYRR